MGVQTKNTGISIAKVLVAACLLTGCVSTADTLSSVNTQPTPEPLQSNGTGATVQTASIQTESTGTDFCYSLCSLHGIIVDIFRASAFGL
ncbi:MAG: hypothetical protein AAFX96_08260, partial [Pseudomonadota bacterium]